MITDVDLNLIMHRVRQAYVVLNLDGVEVRINIVDNYVNLNALPSFMTDP